MSEAFYGPACALLRVARAGQRAAPKSRRHRGRRLNSHHDVVVKGDGTIWFADTRDGVFSDHEGRRVTGDLAAISPPWA